MATISTPIHLSPRDDHNQRLIHYVHPSDWQNPHPVSCYDLVVIGAGTAGLVVAAGVAGLNIGLKIALVEQHLMGGDCLNFGCIPSKCLIRSSRVMGEIKRAIAYGIEVQGEVKADFGAVMARMREIRADISHHDSVQRFTDLGIDVFLGAATFTSGNSLAVGDQTLNFKKAVIATGARAHTPPIEGLVEVGFLTNETVFSLTTLPDRLAIIGGGPIGCELAQALQRLGSQVTLLHNHRRLLNKEDPEAAAIVQQSLAEDGVEIITAAQLLRVSRTETGKQITYQTPSGQQTLTVTEILVGAGRSPNVSGLGLEAIGVEYDPRHGVQVNDYLQTSHGNIYAAGDVCMNWKFTHAADAAARIVIKNMLFSPFGLGRSKLSDLVMPWVTYTDPEIAHVGLDEATVKQQNIAYKTITIPLTNVDRAIADGETKGFLKILHAANSDQILGATLVASHAGEIISEITTAIVGKIGLSQLSTVIHPYPTQGEAIKKAADAYRRTLLTPNSQRLLKWLSQLS
jgi:pyruvate/2-oxoglutarate dehydrogenase complex dihydrolipoamide dehydrogenase (E3) component